MFAIIGLSIRHKHVKILLLFDGDGRIFSSPEDEKSLLIAEESASSISNEQFSPIGLRIRPWEVFTSITRTFPFLHESPDNSSDPPGLSQQAVDLTISYGFEDGTDTQTTSVSQKC